MTRLYTLVGRARKKAKEYGEDWAVVEIDDADDRVLTIMPLEDTRFEEFTAFDGRILEVVEP